jgi:hypothetical protein
MDAGMAKRLAEDVVFDVGQMVGIVQEIGFVDIDDEQRTPIIMMEELIVGLVEFR